jgi:putative spermidine/putrescine transport system ATP-binding protein
MAVLRLGITTLFVTHDQEEALSMADRVGVMRDGRFEQVAAPDQLYAQPATAFMAEFVGTMNRLPGQVVDSGQVKVLDTVVPVRSDAGDPGDRDDSSDGLVGDVDVLVRPEGLLIEALPGGNGIVTDRAFLGSVSRIGVRVSGDVTVKVDHPSTQSGDFVPGASVRISLPPGESVLVAGRR